MIIPVNADHYYCNNNNDEVEVYITTVDVCGVALIKLLPVYLVLCDNFPRV